MHLIYHSTATDLASFNKFTAPFIADGKDAVQVLVLHGLTCGSRTKQVKVMWQLASMQT